MRIRNQVDGQNDNANNPNDGNQSEHLAANVVVGATADIPWQLTDDQARALAPDATLVATMKRMFEEQQNELTNHIIRHVTNVIKPMVVNAINEVIS